MPQLHWAGRLRRRDAPSRDWSAPKSSTSTSLPAISPIDCATMSSLFVRVSSAFLLFFELAREAVLRAAAENGSLRPLNPNSQTEAHQEERCASSLLEQYATVGAAQELWSGSGLSVALLSRVRKGSMSSRTALLPSSSTWGRRDAICLPRAAVRSSRVRRNVRSSAVAGGNAAPGESEPSAPQQNDAAKASVPPPPVVGSTADGNGNGKKISLGAVRCEHE